ncbi:hypothetical protein L1049_018551 [Liquidambar formosana]|uniref:Uncharacterized protein n=1 Tax=Liquidambar formosana TaxID=63359 RepID=A0AAP0WLJ3_LIQFO
MKQPNEQQPPPQSQPPQPLPLSPPPSLEQEGKIKTMRNPRVYPSSTAQFSNYVDNFSYSFLTYAPPNPYSWPASSPISPLPVAGNLNHALPIQTLGLNLNFHDFNNLDASLYLNNNNHPSILLSVHGF